MMMRKWLSFPSDRIQCKGIYYVGYPFPESLAGPRPSYCMEVPTIQAPPPDLPNPYTLASRRPPGSRPVEIIGGGWGKFRDLQTGLFYFVNKANGEATYDRPGGNLGARPIGPPPSAAVDDKLHPNNNVDSSVSHFENVVNTTTAQGPGAVPASQKMGPPPPSQPLSPSSAPLAQPAHYYKLVQEVDMNLFVACRDGKPQKLLNDLIGADIDIEDDAFAEINRQWCARRDGSGWDVLPIYDSGR